MFFNFVHSRDGEIYIYDCDGKEIAFAEFMQQHCELNKEMNITVDDMLSGELCMGCASCPCYSLLLACMQARSLQRQNDILIRQSGKWVASMKITNRDWLNTLPAETFYDILRHKRIELENKYLDTDFDSADTDEAVKYDFITWLESEHKAE